MYIRIANTVDPRVVGMMIARTKYKIKSDSTEDGTISWMYEIEKLFRVKISDLHVKDGHVHYVIQGTMQEVERYLNCLAYPNSLVPSL